MALLRDRGAHCPTSKLISSRAEGGERGGSSRTGAIALPEIGRHPLRDSHLSTVGDDIGGDGGGLSTCRDEQLT